MCQRCKARTRGFDAHIRLNAPSRQRCPQTCGKDFAQGGSHERARVGRTRRRVVHAALACDITGGHRSAHTVRVAPIFGAEVRLGTQLVLGAVSVGSNVETNKTHLVPLDPPPPPPPPPPTKQGNLQSKLLKPYLNPPSTSWPNTPRVCGPQLAAILPRGPLCKLAFRFLPSLRDLLRLRAPRRACRRPRTHSRNASNKATDLLVRNRTKWSKIEVTTTCMSARLAVPCVDQSWPQ